MWGPFIEPSEKQHHGRAGSSMRRSPSLEKLPAHLEHSGNQQAAAEYPAAPVLPNQSHLGTGQHFWCVFLIYIWRSWDEHDEEGAIRGTVLNRWGQRGRTEMVPTCPQQKYPSWKNILVLVELPAGGARGGPTRWLQGRVDVTLQEEMNEGAQEYKFGI